MKWDRQEPVGTVIMVRIRSSTDQEIWSAWVELTSGLALSDISSGKYLQMEVTLQILSGDVSPTVSYVAVFTQDWNGPLHTPR